MEPDLRARSRLQNRTAPLLHGIARRKPRDDGRSQPDPASTNLYTGDTRPYQDWQVLQSVYNAAVSNYNALSVVVEKQAGNGLSFQSSYVFTRDLSNEGGAAPSEFPGAGGNFLTDRFHPLLDYGNVVYDRKHRFLTTALYDLPFGKNKKFLADSTGFLRSLVGNWQIGGVFIWQSGPPSSRHMKSPTTPRERTWSTWSASRAQTAYQASRSTRKERRMAIRCI